MLKKIQKIEDSIWGFFIKKMPITILLLIIIVIFGVNSLMTLPRELQPEINIPIVSITTSLAGANPTDIEKLITKEIEEAVSDIDSIENISSSSNFNFSFISLEFSTNTDIDKAVEEVKSEIDKIKNSLPEDASDPSVSKINANSYAIISFSILGDLELSEISEAAKYARDELEKISGVDEVLISGLEEKEIAITLNKNKLETLGLSINDISNIIQFSDFSLPLGTGKISDLNYSLRVENEIKDIEDLKNLIILSNENEIVYLKDIAEIIEAYPEKSSISRVSQHGQQTKNAVSLSVYKKSEGNIIEIADKSREKMEEIFASNLFNSEITFTASNDNSVFIRSDLSILSENAVQTSLLITLILFLSLGIIEGLVAGLSIPISFLMTFTLMKILGMTINSLSLFSLVIGLGLMVDTSIIIMEGIFDYKKEGFKSKEAALLTIDKYKFPIIAGTLTTVFAFFPMLLVQGIMGEFLKTLPITIGSALISSLIVSLTISPAIANKLLKNKESKKSILEPIFNKLSDFFQKILSTVFKNTKNKILTIFLTLSLFILSLLLPTLGILKVELFGQTDMRYFFIDVELPIGNQIEKTNEIVKDIETYLYQREEIESFVSIVGSSSIDLNLGSSGPTNDTHLANITINLYPEEEREKKSYVIAEEIREHFSEYGKGEITVTEVSEGPPSDAAITLKLKGEDLTELRSLSNEIQSIIKSVEGTKNIDDSYTQGINEFVYTLKDLKLRQNGISGLEVSALIRNIIQGINVMEIEANGEERDIILNYDFMKNENKEKEIKLNELNNFKINTPYGNQITLGEISTFYIGESISSIRRDDEKRTITITAEIENNANIQDINSEIEEKIAKLNLQQGYEISMGGDLEEINESFKDLFSSMIIGIILIAFTLVLMFNSFRQASIILLTLPLALIGVFPGLVIVGEKLSFPAFLGVVALAGIVVNDAIVLIDQINNNRKSQKMSFIESIKKASKARLQPIIMTSITTIIGILPLALTNEFWAGLGFSLIFGLAFSTLLTLIIIPLIYYGFERKKAKKQGELIY